MSGTVCFRPRVENLDSRNLPSVGLSPPPAPLVELVMEMEEADLHVPGGQQVSPVASHQHRSFFDLTPLDLEERSFHDGPMPQLVGKTITLDPEPR